MTPFRLTQTITQFPRKHPNDGFGGPATSVVELRNEAKPEEYSLNDIEVELIRLHKEGAVYLQRWNRDLGQFLPWHTRDTQFFDGLFRILTEKPRVRPFCWA